MAILKGLKMINDEEKQWRKCVVADFKMQNDKFKVLFLLNLIPVGISLILFLIVIYGK